MPGWKIRSFDRAAARGTCGSAVATLPFDASIALVDDFEVGEEVDVSLRAIAGGYEVTRIAPTRWRRPFAAAPGALSAHVAAVLTTIQGRRAWLAGVEDGVAIIQVDDDTYRPPRALRFGGCVMVQMPVDLDAIATIYAFAPAEVARAAPELVRHWPAIPEDCTVFRIDPDRFGAAAAYVVARTIELVPLSGGT